MYVNVEQIFPLNPQTRVKETLHMESGTMFLNLQRWKKKCLPDGGPNSNMAVSLGFLGVANQIWGVAGSKVVSTTGHDTALLRTYSFTTDEDKGWRLLWDEEFKADVPIKYENKSTILLTVEQPAVATQLFQSGQHQSGHYMVRNQCASFYVCLHQHTCLWYTTGKDGQCMSVQK